MVQAGDTLIAIAASFGVTVEAIIAANNITDPELIKVGEEFIIPAAATPASPSTPAPAPIISTPHPTTPPQPTPTEVTRQSNVAPLAEGSEITLEEYAIRLGLILDPVEPANHALVANPPAERRYVAYVIVLEGDVYVNPLNFTLKDADGFVYKHESLILDTFDILKPIQLDSDSQAFGWISFSVRKDAELVELAYEPTPGESSAFFRANVN